MTKSIENFKKVLIVEGYSDLRFYAELLEHVGKSEEVFIQQFGGKSELLKQLEVFLTPQLLAEKTSIGVIVDADNNPTGSYSGLQSRLAEITRFTLSPPGQWSSTTPRIGMMIVPTNTNEGEIETLVWNSWSNDPENEGEKECILNFENCMREKGISAQSPDKGRISALLAFRNDEDPRLGPGAQKGIFDFTREEFDDLRNFLVEI